MSSSRMAEGRATAVSPQPPRFFSPAGNRVASVMALQRPALRAVALAAVALALPATATADHGAPLLDDRLATYFEIAQAHWGGPVPSCVANGVTLIPVHAVLYDDPVAAVAARADEPGCRLWLDRSSWREMRPLAACKIVVHEWGHLLGHGHVEDPLGLMAEFPVRAPAECGVLRRPARAAQASGALQARACGARARRVRLQAGRGGPIRLACVRRARA